mmetsp:Transcript_107584/g.273086  ORF Transcript_107584/g.273086 Transcript_107584/m.273086 type:complete len:197 (-) Transcript_107584:80-670(-)
MPRKSLRDLNDGVATKVVPDSEPVPALLEWARSQPQYSRSGKGGLRLVAPGLFLGNRQTASDRELLRRHGIGAVVCVGAKPALQDLVCHHISVRDDSSQSLLGHFPGAMEFFPKHLSSGVGVLVHCQGGVSRSPAVVLAYLLRHGGLSLAQSLEVLSLAHPGAKPRGIFLDGLVKLEAEIQAEGEWEKGGEADQDQ